jgi:hypothetical protein
MLVARKPQKTHIFSYFEIFLARKKKVELQMRRFARTVNDHQLGLSIALF